MSGYGKCEKCGTDLVLAPGIDVYCPNKQCMRTPKEFEEDMERVGEILDAMNPDKQEIERLQKELDEANKIIAFHKPKSDLADDLYASNKVLRGALNELVRLKRYRDTNGKTASYLKSRLRAWKQAEETLTHKENK